MMDQMKIGMFFLGAAKRKGAYAGTACTAPAGITADGIQMGDGQ